MGKRKKLRIEKITPPKQPHDSQQFQNVELANVMDSNSQLAPNLSSSINFKKVRGHTLMPEIWDLEVRERIIVEFNERNQPIGDEGGKLTSFIGTMVRKPDLAPIHFLTWRDMPKRYKDEMWDIVESKFKFLPSFTNEMKKWVMHDISDKWRAWKADVKAKWFIESLIVEDMCEDISDPRINISQFKILAEHGKSDKAKEKSDKNKENRAKVKDPHCIGTKSFSRIIHEKSFEANGSMPSRVELYISSRTRKDGNIVSSEAAEFMELMKKGLDVSMSTGSSNDLISVNNDLFSQVKGPEKRSRIRCIGWVPKYSMPSSSQTKHPLECCAEWKNRVIGLEGLVINLISHMQKENPNNNNLNECINAAKLFFNKEISYASSAPNSSSIG